MGSKTIRGAEEDRLRRQELGRESRKRTAAREVVQSTGSALGAIGSGIKKIFPRGGIGHPDDLITRGPNRSLYIPSGPGMTLLPGLRPKFDKSLLVGNPNQGPSPRRSPSPSRRRGKPKRNTYNQQMAKMRRKLWG